MKNIKLFFGIVLFLLLLPINLVYATAWDRAQTSKSGIVDMFEVLPEYLQVNSTAENRDFHIKRNERAIGSGTQYYFYFEGGTLTVSMTTDGVFRIGSTILGSSTTGNASYPINLSGGTETTGVLPESQGGFGTSTPKYVRQNDGSSTAQLATNITIAGTGTDTATMRTIGVDISPTEKSYLDGLTSNIQTQINTLGTSTPTANSIVRTGSGTTTIESEWIPNTIILNNLTQITTRNYDDVAGTSTIKPTQVAIGTSTLQGALNAVGTATFSGTVTAGGFSGSGAGLTEITTAFSTVTGSATSNQLPLISGLLGSATATQLPLSLAGMTFTGNTNFPSGIWNSSGSVSIGTSTLTTALQVIGTVTATDFSGNGAGLTNLPSSSVAFSAVTGSASASQLPLISGLLGSATAAQLPTVIRLPGTTTEQAASAFGQLYVQSSSGGGGEDGFAKLLLHMNNPGTSTFADSSASAHTVTAAGNAIGTTTTVKFGSGSLYTAAVGDYLTVPDSDDWNFGAGDFTIDFHVYHNTAIGSVEVYSGQTGSPADMYYFRRLASGALGFDYSTSGSGFTSITTTETVTSNAWHHIALVRNGATTYMFIDGVAATLSGNIAGTLYNSTQVLNIGRYGAVDPNTPLKGYTDELRISKGIARWTSNFTPPASPYSIYYTQYSAKYKDPVNGNTVLEIVTTGTASTEASYIYNNATTTVFGLGTNTEIIATITAYSGWFDGAVRATAFNVASTEKIKENIKDIKIKPDLLDAEDMAKYNYIANNKIAWIAANGENYTTVVNETGTGSVIVVDTEKMESDYNSYIELEWASDMNQDTYTENIQKTHEIGFWQMFDSVTPRSWNPKDKPTLTRKGFVVEDMPPVVKGDDGQSIDPMALIAYMSVVQQALKADTIFALSTLKELLSTGTVTQQKIDYVNDRLEVLNP